MIVKDISFQSPLDNILYDEVLFRLAQKETGQEVLRFWESPVVFIVLGRISSEEDDIKHDAVAQDSIPVVRRTSGGGTVMQGKGCLNYSLVLSKEKHPEIKDLKGSYAYILGKVVHTLEALDIKARFHPISDIALEKNQKKFSGNAQKRTKDFILHHGTILYDFDLNLIEKYLHIPKDIPDYRDNRSHHDFVTNVAISPKTFKAEMKKIFFAERQDPSVTLQESTLLLLLKNQKNI